MRRTPGAPLLLSFDVAALGKAELGLYGNAEIVAVSQDADAAGRGSPGGHAAPADATARRPRRTRSRRRGAWIARRQALCSVSIQFILPGGCYVLLFRDAGWPAKRLLALGQLLLGMVICPLCLVLTFLPVGESS